MKDKVAALINKGFFHIFGSRVINKMIQFLSSAILVRLLSKEQYGLYSYTQNLLMFFILFNGLGVPGGMLQFGSETTEEEERISIFKYGIKIGMLFNIVVAIAIFIGSIYLPLEFESARPLLEVMALIPIVNFILDSIQLYFRSTLENKKFSLIGNLDTLLTFIFAVLGAYYFKVMGVVVSRYVAILVPIIVGLNLVRIKKEDLAKAKILSEKVKKEFLKYSIVSSLNNAIAQMLYVIDVFLIGIYFSNELVIASYRTATLIPFALTFIPSSIMIFVYPYFSKNKDNKAWVRRSYATLTGYLAVLNILISLFLFTFAPLIIKLLFGSQYMDALQPFRILSIGYFFAGTFRIPVGNLLNMLREVKFGLYLSIVTGGLNIILDIVLIKMFGAIGAAYANLSVFVFTSAVGVIYINHKLKIRV